MSDNLDFLFEKFFQERNSSTFRGCWRAVVIDTNDPLNMSRIRVCVPAIHDPQLKDSNPELYPWAALDSNLGGKGCGSWKSPVIGDFVWVKFEQGHDTNLIWTGFATPTRRAYYPLQSIHQKTPKPLDEEGNPEPEIPEDYNWDYLPKDGRPMSIGQQDRYGNFTIMNSVGFFPNEHANKPTDAGRDAMTNSKYNAARREPEINNPDRKYIVTSTKYGNFILFGDTGYNWKEEFTGNFTKDKKFEETRAKRIQKLFNEDKPKDKDQRRIELRTRYGHKIEMRDVGWNHTRPGEWGDQAEIAKTELKDDERWIKVRTKAGHLFQMIDTGADEKSDEYIKRLLNSEVGAIDSEKRTSEVGFDPGLWHKFKEGDKRQIRLISRYGFKFVLDDRGTRDLGAYYSSPGLGIMLKTKRGPNPGDRIGTGFGLEFNETDDIRHSLMYTPKSKIFEMSDQWDHIVLCTDTAKPIASKWQGTKNNNFSGKNAITEDILANTYHLLLDKENKRIRLKCPPSEGKNKGAGFEAHVGSGFTELIDQDGNGLVHYAEEGHTSWFSPKEMDQRISMIDKSNPGTMIQIVNLVSEGKIQIVAKGNIEIISEDSDIQFSCNKFTVNAEDSICLKGGNGSTQINSEGLTVGSEVFADKLHGIHVGVRQGKGGKAGSASGASCAAPKPEIEEIIEKLKPDDFDEERGKDPQKPEKIEIPLEMQLNGGGGIAGGGGGAPYSPPAPSPLAPSGSPIPTPEPPIPPDPLAASGGVLWYGTSTKFEDEIKEKGLVLSSYNNILNIPPNTDATKYMLATSLEASEGKKFAKLMRQRYGEKIMILRIFGGIEEEKVEYPKDDYEIAYYFGSVPADKLEIYAIGNVVYQGTPKYNI